jgi:hypothetical protein
VKFDSIRYVQQKDGFFNIRYSVTLPPGVYQAGVRLAIAKEDFCRDPSRDSDYIIHKLPSLSIPQRPGKYGVNLTEDQAKLLLWLMMNFGMWGRPVTAYLVVWTCTTSGPATTISDPVILDCPLEPIFGVGFNVGDVNTTRQLGALMTARQIPYEINACLLLNLNLFGINVLFFHSNKKLITATHPSLRRGLNCITFADAAVGTKLDNVMNLDGRGIATAAGATMVLNGVLGNAMRDYFSDANRPTWERESYVFWWEVHVVVIYRGTVCEYAHSAGSYRETPVQQFMRPFKTSTLYLARL